MSSGFDAINSKLPRTLKGSLYIGDLRYTGNQQAVIDLAKEAKKLGGISDAEARILLEFADEYNIPFHGPEIHPNRPGIWSNTYHIHVGKVGHIPIK